MVVATYFFLEKGLVSCHKDIAENRCRGEAYEDVVHDRHLGLSRGRKLFRLGTTQAKNGASNDALARPIYATRKYTLRRECRRARPVSRVPASGDK
jgi:hypothetical protein